MRKDKQNIRILVVDAEDKVRNIISRILREEGYIIADASDGDDAIFQLTQADFNLVIMDIKMPGMRGLEVLHEIRTGYPDTKVIILTGITDKKPLETATKEGVFAYLTKPCSMNELRGTVSQALGLVVKLEEPKTENPTESSQSGTGPSILVVDDEDHIRNNICRALAGEGYTAIGAASGEEALFKASQQDFQVVLLDIRMPGMDGLELLPKLRSEHQGIKVIMLTGMGDRETVQAALAGNACDFLIKPCPLDRLIERVEKVLKQGEKSNGSLPIKYSHGKSILVVDDEEHVRRNICRALEMEDYDVVDACNGQDALYKLSQEKFNVVLLDINMPGMNGTEVLHKIKSNYPDTFVIMLTALVERNGETQADCMMEGAFAYLQKPCRLDTVVKTVEAAFKQEAEYWDNLVASPPRDESITEEDLWKAIDEPEVIK